MMYFSYSSPIGEIYVASTRKGICLSALSGTESEFTAALKMASGIEPLRNNASFTSLIDELHEYFSGEMVTFSEPIDWLGGTIFQRSIWEALRQIPYGETRSYKEVAEAVGRPKAYRATGQAVGKNPIPLIVPCHRVINSDGGLGGFGGGLPLKRKLLEIESKPVSLPQKS